MKNFKGGGGGGFGGGQRFGGGNNKNHERNGGGKFGGGQSRGFKGGDRVKDRSGEMFSATCSTCGKNCEVPFRPSSDKPVYCSACFGKKSLEMGRESRGDRREPEFKRDDRPMRDQKPARREEQDENSSASLKELTFKLSSLEGKVSRILDILNAQIHEATSAPASVPKPETAKKVSKTKVEKGAVAKTAPVKKVAKKVTKTVTPVKKAVKVIKKAKK